jgi:hypothetical protein
MADTPVLRTLNIEELAAVLKKSPATIKSDMNRRPASLPPPIGKLPHSQTLLWLVEDVLKWMRESASPPAYLDPNPRDNRPLHLFVPGAKGKNGDR